MKHTITVLQDDIDNGARKARLCAIALAVNRELFGVGACISFGGIVVQVQGVCLRGRLPAAAREFLYRFDARLPVEPFKFEVELTEEAVPFRTVQLKREQYGLSSAALLSCYLFYTNSPKYTSLITGSSTA